MMDLFKDKSSDEILLEITGFIVMIGTLSAVILAYDTIVRERQENSIDFLLCRPVRKGTILTAKFLGVLLLLPHQKWAIRETFGTLFLETHMGSRKV